jgi:hypothetical protein
MVHASCGRSAGGAPPGPPPSFHPRVRLSLVPVVAAVFLSASPSLGSRDLSAQPSQVPEPTDSTRRRLVARRATGVMRLDGHLTEDDWRSAPVARDFMQVRPDYVPGSAFQSEVRILYDDEHLYVGAFNRDTAGASLRIPDLRRDFDASESDLFGITFGPLGDRRTSFQLQVNPLGSQSDVQAFDGGDEANFNWDAMWRVRTSRSDSGWYAEMAIPWTSIRYASGLRAWDLNLVRNTRRALQWSAWMPYPRQFSSWRLTYAGILDSIQPPPTRTNLRFRPYALVQGSRDDATGGRRSTIGDVGGEAIWAPSANSLLEATISTDFAQADVDRQVVNLTRFSVFLPERRQFFLENADLLNAGGLSGRYVVQPFFSRRIGLASDGALQPIDGGLRYAYRSGRTTAGALAMRQAETAEGAASTFGVVRGSRFFGRSTRVGSTVAVRRDDESGATSARENVVTAIDAFARIGEQVQMSGMLSTSTLDGVTGMAATYFVGRETPRLYTGILGALVTEDYDPQTGFVSRPNVLLTSPAASYTWQPASRPSSIVWFKPGVTTYFYQDPSSGRLQEGVVTVDLDVLRSSGAVWTPFVERNLQRPTEAVALLPNVAIAAGDHDYWRYGVDLKSDQSAVLATAARLSAGSFFDGRLQQAVLSGRWSPSPYLAIRGSYEVNRLRSLGTRDTSLVTHLAGPEVRAFLNPRVQWSAFYQYNSVQQQGSLNARFSWEFAPLSFLYVVYNTRDPVAGGENPRARSLIVKLSWLRQL